MENKELENKAVKRKPKKATADNKYITTDTYPCLPKGVGLTISNKIIADKFIKKGYIKHVKK